MVTKRDLPVLTPRTLPNGSIIEAIRPELLCPSCADTWSAHPGDYWNLPDDHVFRCPNCPEDGDDNGKDLGEPLELVRRVVTFEPWGVR